MREFIGAFADFVPGKSEKNKYRSLSSCQVDKNSPVENLPKNEIRTMLSALEIFFGV